MTIGSFILIKNEIAWIEAHLKSWLPHLDQMIFYDGNSTDGTLEVLTRAARENMKVQVYRNKDPKNLQQDYVDLFDECLHRLDTTYAMFLHPDMICQNPGGIRSLDDGLAYTTEIESFGGEPGGDLFKLKGRAEKWKNIYRLKDPDLGLHYHGFYGARNEDCYFREITGDTHDFHGEAVGRYPYHVGDSGCKIYHYSDVRPLNRRINRMKACLVNQGYSEAEATALAPTHPRVTLKSGGGIEFEPAEYPEDFKCPA